MKRLPPTQIFESKRLSCRRWEPSDFSDIFSLYAHPEAMRFVDDGLPIEQELCRQWLKKTAENYERHGYGMFLLTHREPPFEFVGCIGLVHPGGQAQAELKYALDPRYWGHGFASEAVEAMLVAAGSLFKLGELMATVHPDNHASQRVLEKSGFIEVQPRLNPDGTETLVYERMLECHH